MSVGFTLNYEIVSEFSESDLYKINQMIISVWDYNSWVQEENVEPMAEFFLSEVIINSSRIFVARDGEQIVGVIAASLVSNIRQKAKAKIKKYKSLKKLFSEKGNEVFDCYLDTLILCENLLLRSGRSFNASLNLFILDERYQGLGIGNKLYSRFLEYLADMNADNFFLYTDDSSNFQFYERKGLNRIEEEEFYWRCSNQNNERYYLYEGKV
ncbi:acetyltransferase, GNAT family [Acinetobacter sp. neg1]|uniref:GNAT family N-acetyltransferase n=1 Tax=Acinetobacter sp. neg1 TaxID=1561068 RepID=UPI0005443CAE|nr:GNAT family N-acetyltransferase [Acinetobacter sp. neg1]KHF78804.1 acetyltransferase, GNAT family [Acinetobacter sp. neg1]